MSITHTLGAIAKWIDGSVRGDASMPISGVNAIADAGPEEITWLADPEYAGQLAGSRAGAVIVPRGFGETRMPAVLVDSPKAAIITVLGRFAPPVPRPAAGVHPTALVAPTARLGKDVAVGPHAVIEERAAIGAGSVIHANAFIGADVILGRDCMIWTGVVIRERCTLGERVVIHPNTTIGADGFGFEYLEGRHVHIPQIGTVVIEDDVEIGANACIDRAKFGATRIGRGTKIDNLVQVAHNVVVGADCLLVAQCGIGGSARLGRGVVLGGKAGVRDHAQLGDGVQGAACCCISKDVPAGTTMVGSPALERQQFVRERAMVRQVPRLIEQLKDLIQRVKQLEAPADDR